MSYFQDVQWNDIDYMHDNNDFTYDKVNFAGLPEFVKEIHDEGMHYVVIIGKFFFEGIFVLNICTVIRQPSKLVELSQKYDKNLFI